jgi:CRISPR-associated exonuclease Cas4
MLPLAIILALIAILFLWLAKRQQLRTGMPGGRVIYADTRGWQPVEEPLYAADLGLTGRPDYLVEQGGRLVPVEVKSTRIEASPYDTHIYQLAAYCLLVERVYKTRPRYGILHYPNRTFRIDFTNELEAAVLSLIDEIRTQERRKDVPRSHDQPARCAHCGFSTVCDQRLR